MQLEDAVGNTDYIIIGSGIAGLFTAIRLAKSGRVAVLSKQDLIAGNTWFAQGGIAAAFSAEDSPELHLEDTWKAGVCFGERSAISVLVEEAPDRIKDLLEMGVNFDRRNGSIDLGREGAHSRKRILHIGGDATGKELVETLLLRARSEGVIFIEDAFAEQIIVEDGRCRGICYAREKRRFTLYARAVILAAGGCGQIYKCTTNAPAVTGDGLAMAYQAGAVLRDLEYFQFHPTVFFPPQGSPFLISEAVRGEGARLVNTAGESFMGRFHPQGELGPRDVVSRAILAEQQRTGREVYLDLRHLGGDFVKKRFPTIYNRCREWGFDVASDLLPVSPAAHYLIGGIQVDLDGRTAVENLFAVGEVASTGVHGANRLASNSLLEGLVFGHRVALAAAALKQPGFPNQVSGLAHNKPADSSDERLGRSIRPQLQSLMWGKAGLIRTEDGLIEARGKVKQWWPLLECGLTEAALTETQNMLLIAGMMIEAALERRESRGCHYRGDYPDPDLDYGLSHIVFQKEENSGGRGETAYPRPSFLQ
ncbi:MAG: L-aspartate oxidase [Bacillota bacterium]